jgi:RNA polymerase sigma-70 factor (ECF subfamily)
LDNNQLHLERELFALISEGDEQAFEQLFNLYLPRIQPVVLQIVKRENVAKDLVQDVFLRLWLSREKLSEIQDPKSYIFRIVYNQSFNYTKRQSIERKAAAVLASGPEGSDRSDSLEHALDMAEVRRLVEMAIRELPPKAKRIYRLSRDFGYKQAEIASQLGISPRTVRNSLSRSGEFIRDYLERQGIVLPLLLILLALG